MTGSNVAFKVWNKVVHKIDNISSYSPDQSWHIVKNNVYKIVQERIYFKTRERVQLLIERNWVNDRF